MKSSVIDPARYGVSFSAKQCRNFAISPSETLQWLLDKGWRRFRLMSYWNEHEKKQGNYDFSELDRQVDAIRKAGGIISLCLGVKQPRWPEYHWPAWTHKLSQEDKREALLRYTQAVVTRYRDEAAVISYQLENEALLSNFGRDIDIDRKRLRQEYQLVRLLDPATPIYMSTSNGWGIPLRSPRPWGGVGFSVYTSMHSGGKYRRTIQKPWLHKLRKHLIRALLWRPVFIHELQAEPWGPTAIWKMGAAEQDRSMSPEQLRRNITWAKRIGAYPVDLWGGEWWYWRWHQGDNEIWQTVRDTLQV